MRERCLEKRRQGSEFNQNIFDGAYPSRRLQGHTRWGFNRKGPISVRERAVRLTARVDSSFR